MMYYKNVVELVHIIVLYQVEDWKIGINFEIK